jgi:putative ABC transport system permease protein
MTTPRFAARFVRLASMLVPRWRRGEWRREWNAELAAQATDTPDAHTIVARSVGSLADAAALRRQSMYVELWIGDLRLACRNAIRRPAFTALFVGTLALGIGAASAVMALVDAVLVRQLPYPDPSRLVFVWTSLPSQHMFEAEASPFDYTAWRRARSFSSLAIVATNPVTLTGGGEPERVHGARVSASLLPLLGIAPQIGHGFTPADDADAAAPTAILGEGLWRRRYGGDRAIVGRSIEVDGVPRTVIGVMPVETFLPGPLAGSDDVWLPLRFPPAERDNEISHNYDVVGRLAPGASTASATSEVNAIAAALAADRPDTHTGLGARVVTVAEQTAGPIRSALLLLLAGVGLLAAIACANAATLLVARASDRQQELAVRAAIGATRLRLLSLAFAESLVLTGLAAMAGLALGDWMLRLLLPQFTGVLPPGAHVAIDQRIAVGITGSAIAIALVFALMVAAHQASGPPIGALQSGIRAGGSARAARTRGILVTVQIGLAVLLLSGGGLMAKSFARLHDVRPGFDASGLLTFRIALPELRYGGARATAQFVDDLVGRLTALPGVQSAGANTRLPFGGARGANGIAVDGRPASPGELPVVDQREVTADYFQVMRMPIVSGRGFSDRDTATSEPVAIVNRAMAARFWSGASPLDRRIRVTAGDEESGWLRIVGLVDDVKHISLARAPVAEMYRPFAQMPLRDFAVVLRTANDPTAETGAVRAAIQSLDRRLPIYDVRTMDARIASSLAQSRATALLLGTAAILAALLGAIAIYGSIWYAVAQRQPEIGVRIALGATPWAVCRLVLGGAVGLAVAGASIGIGAALTLTPFIQAMLFDTRANDPATYAAVVTALLILTLAASLAPARRAMRTDPVTALRSD